VTGSAASWAADLLTGLDVDGSRMRANLGAARDLPMAENVAAMLAPELGRVEAHDLVSAAAARATAQATALTDALLADANAAATLSALGIGRAELQAAANPENYLGASAEFIRRALAAHRRVPRRADAGQAGPERNPSGER
jgi:3-carboxy-cis,cis-muconate cycloisomerase